jgi:hypothetical protein
MTGLGLDLYEYTRQKFGSRINGLNFASTFLSRLHSDFKFELRTNASPRPMAASPQRAC